MCVAKKNHHCQLKVAYFFLSLPQLLLLLLLLLLVLLLSYQLQNKLRATANWRKVGPLSSAPLAVPEKLCEPEMSMQRHLHFRCLLSAVRHQTLPAPRRRRWRRRPSPAPAPASVWASDSAFCSSALGLLTLTQNGNKWHPSQSTSPLPSALLHFPFLLPFSCSSLSCLSLFLHSPQALQPTQNFDYDKCVWPRV